MSEKNQNEKSLNKGAKEYVPTKNRKLNFNLDAKEYQPKEKQKNKELDEDEDAEVNNKLDMIVNDMVVNDLLEEAKDNDSEDEDENKFFDKYKNCSCCKGHVYKCNGEACKSLRQCYCKMSDDCEKEDN